MTFWVFAAVFAAVAWVGAGLCWRFMAPRRRSTLSYTVPRPRRKGLVGLGQEFGEATQRMTYGTSLQEWQRRCKASLAASRRRRGLD